MISMLSSSFVSEVFGEHESSFLLTTSTDIFQEQTVPKTPS